jgi:hypothetical protein
MKLTGENRHRCIIMYVINTENELCIYNMLVRSTGFETRASVNVLCY